MTFMLSSFIYTSLGLLAVIALTASLINAWILILARKTLNKTRELFKDEKMTLTELESALKELSDNTPESSLVRGLRAALDAQKKGLGRARAYAVLHHHLDSIHEPHLRSFLWVIPAAAAAAPALGLLGTVIGLRGAFAVLGNSATPDPQQLALNISLALDTTLYGLFISIPALMVYASLTACANWAARVAERVGTHFVEVVLFK
ncbi:MAG: MotA/TolQ/ExbB proton channel family protein [Planctomycetaceae bacterium]